jgi:hypothetical protein
MKNVILALLFFSSIFATADEIFFVDGTDDLDIIAKEGWVFVEDSAFLDINQTNKNSHPVVDIKEEDRAPQISLFDYRSSDKSECNSGVMTKKKKGCKSSR